MNQIQHIFRKDVRALWYEISVTLGLQALFTYFEMRPYDDRFAATLGYAVLALVSFLLPIAWWYLIAKLVQEEPLTGDRQFWVTRPYRWQNLMAAKALAIFALVNLPMFISDCFILQAQGFPVTAHYGGILWRQLPFTVLVLLPPLALSSVTRNLGQMIPAILLILLRFLAAAIPLGDPPWAGSTAFGWIVSTAFVIELAAVVIVAVTLQYGSRRTRLARGALAAFVLVPGIPIPFDWQFNLQRRLAPPQIDTAPIRITYDPGRGRRAPAVYGQGANTVDIVLPVTVKNAPNSIELSSYMADLTLNGHELSTGARLYRESDGYWEQIAITPKLYNSLRNKPVTIRFNAVVTASRQTEFRAPLRTGPITVPYVGICESKQALPLLLQIICRWPLRNPPLTRVHTDPPGWSSSEQQTIGKLSESPWPAELFMSPVQRIPVLTLMQDDLKAALRHPNSQVVFETLHPVADFRIQFELHSVKLADFAIAVPSE